MIKKMSEYWIEEIDTNLIIKASRSCSNCGGAILVFPHLDWFKIKEKISGNIPTYFCEECDKEKIKEIYKKIEKYNNIIKG
jgi:ribosomal protein S27AE